MLMLYAIAFDFPEEEVIFAARSGRPGAPGGFTPSLNKAAFWLDEDDASAVLADSYDSTAQMYGAVVEVGEH
jgi:hypothetical protein